MPLERFKNRALLLKVEATEGTDAAPAAATDAFQLMDGSSGVLSEKIERTIDRPFFTHDPFVNTNIRAFIEGGFEIVPPSAIVDNTSKAAVEALFKISGMAKTFIAATAGPPATPAIIRYNPISSSFASGTAHFYHAGTLYRLTGARANITSVAMEIGNYLRAQTRIEGSCQEVEESALPGGLDYSAFTTPVANTTESMEMRINGFAVEGKSIGLDFGNELQTVEHSEARINRIRDRRPTFTARFYRPARGSLDPFALWKAGTIFPLFGTITDPTSGLQTKMNIRGQIEDVRPQDIDGDYGYEITGRCIASDAGGDEFTFEFSDTTA
jgi:hypothetical protein